MGKREEGRGGERRGKERELEMETVDPSLEDVVREQVTYS